MKKGPGFVKRKKRHRGVMAFCFDHTEPISFCTPVAAVLKVTIPPSFHFSLFSSIQINEVH